ncbi:MAG: hypothetical protein IJ612_06710 [Prevotella sp.]|nr:hypothetical protein [Prevotella sp.]
MPSGVVTHLEARLLKELVNREIHPIRCAESCKRKFMRGMRLGDLCAETGHFWWARKIWLFTAALIEDKDYDDWRYVWFDNNRVRLTDVISETECELLYRRCSDLWRNLGYPEYAWWDERMEKLASNYFGTSYFYLFADKYDGYYELSCDEWEEQLAEARAQQDLRTMFREGQGDNLPACSQDFTEYWHGGPHTEDYS